MIKKKKIIISSFVVIVFLIFGIYGAYNYGNKLLDKRTKNSYISNCQSSASKNFPKSSSELYDSCVCSYDKLNSFLGRDTMRDFTKVVLKKNKNLTNEFLANEKIDIRKLDSAFLSCF